MINGWTRLNMYSKLAWQINILHSISINMIIIVSITRTLNRLDIMNDKIRSREWYLTIVDVVDGGGNADGVDDGAKSRSSMSSGGTFHWRSLEPGNNEDGVSMQPSEDEPSWRIWEQSREERFPKTLFVFSQCRIAKTRVPEICSPKRQCTQTIGIERLRR
jgi:hypothetical protein